LRTENAWAGVLALVGALLRNRARSALRTLALRRCGVGSEGSWALRGVRACQAVPSFALHSD
jgi:hypothetical protein